QLLARYRQLRHTGDEPSRPRPPERRRVVRPAARRANAPPHRRPRPGSLMSEWWTYTIADIKSFSLETWYRLFELYNRAIWPAQIAALMAGLAMGSGLHLPHREPGRHTWRSCVIAALGLILTAAGRVRWELVAVPLLWCGISAATLLSMRAPDTWIPLAAAVVAVLLATWKTLARRRDNTG